MYFEFIMYVEDFLFFASCLFSLSGTSVPPFLMRSRPKAIRINGRILSISFHGEALLSQLIVVGGNKTGVFVHKVTEGSAAHTVGISPGAQIVEVSASVFKNSYITVFIMLVVNVFLIILLLCR